MTALELDSASIEVGYNSLDTLTTPTFSICHLRLPNKYEYEFSLRAANPGFGRCDHCRRWVHC